jgi:hypothetical protein
MSNKNVLANLEWLALSVGVTVTYDPQEEWFVVETGDGTTVKNSDLREALDVAREIQVNGGVVEN